jgi:hypothetical protein
MLAVSVWVVLNVSFRITTTSEYTAGANAVAPALVVMTINVDVPAFSKPELGATSSHVGAMLDHASKSVPMLLNVL